MGSVIAFGLLFALFAGLLTVSSMLVPEASVNNLDRVPTPSPIAEGKQPATIEATDAATSTPEAGSEEPETYLWVILLEFTLPGQEFPTIITKRSGAFVSPDRREEVAGGIDANGEAWNRFVTVLGNEAWERTGGPVPTWTRVEDAAPALDHAGVPPYWGLFHVDAQAFHQLIPERVQDDYAGTPALHYELMLSDLPNLRAYLAASLSLIEGAPQIDTMELGTVPVSYWLRASDNAPLRIQIFPPKDLGQGTQVSFNIHVMNLNDPRVVVEEPGTSR